MKESRMTITVNGKSREATPGTTVKDLLDSLGMETDRVAVELNRTILPKNRFAQNPLQDGDVVEIVQFVGGG